MKINKIILLICIAFFIILVNIFCSKSGSGGYNNTPPGGTSGNNVSIAGMAFSPSTITVKVGTVITWKNNDGYAHTVTSDDGTSFNSSTLPGGNSFSFTAGTAGTFNYHCNIHSGMKGSIVVNP